MKDKKVGSVIKTEAKVIAYVVICLVIIVLGISYALFFEVKGNEKNQIVKAGTLEFTYASGSQITNATNSDCFIPMSNEEALSHSECEYKVSITNTGTLPGNYNINLNSESVENPIALSKLKVILKKEGEVVSDYPKEGTTTSLVTNEKIEAGSVINYSVQVYVDEELVDANDDEKNISLKINGDAVVNSEEVNPGMPAIDYIKNIATVESGDGLYVVPHEALEELGQEWNKTEYRYAGLKPNNYVKFNNEIWRIIGVVNVKTENGIEQRVKIVRQDGVEGQKDFGNYAWDKDVDYINEWNTSKLKDMLNGIYYESDIGECYTGNNGSTAVQNTCDFSGNSNLPKGLDETTKNMIDKEVIWNIGSSSNAQVTAKEIYEKERGIDVYSDIKSETEWSNKTDVGNKFNGIGLIYPSDYGYAVGGSVRNTCLTNYLSNYNSYACKFSDWLTSTAETWTLTSVNYSSYVSLYLHPDGHIGVSGIFLTGKIFPSLYLKLSIKILPNPQPNQEYGSLENPFVLQ